MIFLIEYDRLRGRVMTCKRFDDRDLAQAENERLQIELALNREGVDREVVLLEATTEQALRRTHRRYFESLHELLSPPAV
jgi:hypothetical protein